MPIDRGEARTFANFLRSVGWTPLDERGEDEDDARG
jgi:hypothetical protein